MIDSARAFNHLVITIGRVMYCRYLINKSIRTYVYCIYITQTDCLDRRLITPIVRLIVYYMGQCTRCARDFCTYPYAQMLIINAHADVSSKARAINFSMGLYQHPYFDVSEQRMLLQVCASVPSLLASAIRTEISWTDSAIWGCGNI